MSSDQLEAAHALAHQDIEITNYANNPLVGIALALARAKLALADRDYAVSIERSDKLLSFMNQNQIRQFLPHAFLTKSRALLTLEQVEPAAAILNQALQVSLDMQAQWSLWQVYAALARVEAGRGNTERAASHRAQSQSLIDSIAQRTPEAYRARWLERVAREL